MDSVSSHSFRNSCDTKPPTPPDSRFSVPSQFFSDKKLFRSMAERRRVNTQSSQSLTASVSSRSFGNSCNTEPPSPPDSKFSVPSQVDSGSKKWRSVDSGIMIDPRKKAQCWVILKRLLIHPDSMSFKEPFSSQVLDLDTIQAMLLKCSYVRTQEFAEDIRATLSYAMKTNPPRTELHKMARNLSRIFESNWKSLEEKWAAESGESKKNSKAHVFTEVKKSQKVMNEGLRDSQHFDNTSKTDSINELVKKRKDSQQLNDDKKSQFRQKRKNSYLGLSEYNADSTDESVSAPNGDYLRFVFRGQDRSPNSSSQNVFATVISNSKVEAKEASSFVAGRPKYPILDPLLTSQKSLPNFCEATQREQEENEAHIRAAEIKDKREANRLRLQEMERSVDVEDNLQMCRELDQLSGHTLKYYTLKVFGLKLKQDWE